MTDIELAAVRKRFRRTSSGRVRSLRRVSEWRRPVEVWALDGVSVSIRRGEAFGLIGKNGSGKSTLLRVVAGVTRATSGRIFVARKISGLLTLGEGLHPMLSAEESAVTGAILAGLTRRKAIGRLADIAAFAELEAHMTQPLRTFSDGMRLRLAFAVAINVDPEILLIDEVLAVGDLRFREKCLTRVEELHSSGVTVVLASHDLEQVAQRCQRALWLADGRPRLVGPASEVVARYRSAMNEGLSVRPHPSGGQRLGSGEVEITDVRLLDVRGRECSQVAPGGILTIEIHYRAHQPVPDAIFGVSAHSQSNGVCSLDISTETDGHSVGPLRGEGAIVLHFDRVDLPADSYRFDVGIYASDWDRPYDYLWQAFPLQVETSDHHRHDNPHRWSAR